MTSLPLSMLLLPVARDSVWERVFGMPYERLLRYHRLLGVWFLTANTTHMLAWYVKWWVDGTWVLSVFTIFPPMQPSDFTVPLMELAWICAVTMAITAMPYFRRKHYELFRYSHHLFLFIILATLVHAWSVWYFLVGGLSFWFLDRCARLLRGTRRMEVVAIEHGCGHITRIVLRSKGFVFRPGQYAFVNIPAISALEVCVVVFGLSPSPP
jgi:hypothetical protein